MQTLAPQRSPAERHKPASVLSRKEWQGQTVGHEQPAATPFFVPLPVVQTKCDTCQEEEKPGIQAKAEPAQPAPIQAKCADCEEADVQRTEEETPDVQASAETATTLTNRSLSDFSRGLTVSQPNDRFEREADQMGEQVSRMPLGGVSGGSIGLSSLRVQRQEVEEADVQAKSIPNLQREADGGMRTSGQFTTQVQAGAGGGTALAAPVQQQMGTAFGADFSSVRIHTDTRAAQLSNDIGAKAFTYRNDIYFNQNQYDTTSTEGRFLLAHELTHTVQQGAAVRRATLPVTATAPRVQPSLFDEALDWMADHFNPDVIPGYSLLSVIIEYDLVRRRRVERTPENLVKGLLELIPVFGFLLFNLLQEHGVIGRAFTWVSSQLTRLNLNQARITGAFRQAWDGINIDATDVFDVGAAIDRNLEAIKRPFVALKNDVVSFIEALADQLMTMLKEALVSVLKGLAIDRLRGYKLFTKVIGHDPITGEDVQAPLEEILADFLDLIGSQQEREEMQKRGTLQRTADWLRAQLARFMGLLGQFRALVTHLWDAFSFETLRDPMGTLNGLITEGTQLVVDVVDFALDVATTVLRFIKDALLGLLRTHAHGIRGYKLLTVMLGRDPVTDTTVERNAVNLIGGFIELVAGPEKFAEIQQSGAIERMIAWLEAQIERFQITWEGIKQLFANIWNSLQISDLINPIGAFIRVVGQFEEPIGRLVGFVVEVVKKVIMTALELMNFPFDLIGQIVERAMQAYEDIKRDPIAFLKNLLNAVKQGFSQFFGNIGTHLLNGLVGWLTSELQSAGIRPPQDFTFRSVLTFVLDVLGISMEKIWQKLAEHPRIGPQKVARIRGMIDRLTGIWTFVKEVIEEGPGAIWRHIQEQLANLWDMVLDKVKSWIMEQIIDRMVARLLSMLDPTGVMAVINSFIAFYRAVQSFIERLREILEVINSFVGAVAEIARGVVASAANFLERAMASALPTMIGFLANQVGLRGLGSRIGEMIQSVQELVDRGLTWLVNKAVEMGMSLLNSLGLGGGDEEKGDVKATAKSRLKNTLGQDATIEEANTAAQTILTELRPQGLKRLSVVADPQQPGSYLIDAEASPLTHILRLRSRVTNRTPRVVLAVRISLNEEASPFSIRTSQRRFGKIEKDMVEPNQGLVSGTISQGTYSRRDSRSGNFNYADIEQAGGQLTSGGAVFQPSQPSHEIELLTWNTTREHSRDTNHSHAEYQFDHYIRSNQHILRNVKKLELHLSSVSPCDNDCHLLGSLSQTIRGYNREAEFRIRWSTIYDSGYMSHQHTTSEGINALTSNHWIIEGGDLPAGATATTQSNLQLEDV